LDVVFVDLNIDIPRAPPVRKVAIRWIRLVGEPCV
jgi:hypothetical protein